MSTNALSVTTTPCPLSDVLKVSVIDSGNGFPWIELITVFLSLIAIAISIYSIVQTRTVHKATLASNFFASIFKDYLINLFPNSREKVCFDNGRIKGHETLVDQLNELRRKILYFKYADNQFYSALRKALQELENYVVQAMNSTYDSTAQTEFFAELDGQMTRIFVQINKRHCGM